MELPEYVTWWPEFQLFVWKPQGVLDEKAVNRIISFIGSQEAALQTPFNRFTDLSVLDAVELNFKFVFHVSLYRRLSYMGRPPVKSAFFVTNPEAAHFVKLHLTLTDHSPLHVAVFEKPEAAAKWLDVPIELIGRAAP
jgi:hypothetical protein